MFKFLAYSTLATACVAGILAALLGAFLLTTPRPSDIRSCLTTKMFQVRLCPTEPGYVKLKDVAPVARNAIIVSEDGSFYDHHGFDLHELQESIAANLDKGGFARGGSTITQQLAKNVYLTQEKSLLRKVREALIVVQLEEMLSKDEILEKYLNVVEFGPELYGIGNASRYYFKKPPSQLTAAEGAFLAFLLPSPKKHSISFNKKQLTKFARTQTREIVNRLLRYKRISEGEQLAALDQLEHLFGGGPAAIDATGSSDESDDGDVPFAADESIEHDLDTR
jgi:monofunctional biosynthetic peptidoglycan transglycosylase